MKIETDSFEIYSENLETTFIIFPEKISGSAFPVGEREILQTVTSLSFEQERNVGGGLFIGFDLDDFFDGSFMPSLTS